MISKYIKKYENEYCKGLEFNNCYTENYEIQGIKIIVYVQKHRSNSQTRIKAHVILSKKEYKYEFDSVDIYSWKNNFYPLKLNDKDLICFRKTLYGFTFLNKDTLKEEFEFFPEKVLNGDESFIIVNAKSFKDLVIFDGCYWACPYGYYAFDYKTKKFLNLSNEFDIWASDDFECEIENNLLILKGVGSDERFAEIHLDYDKLKNLISRKGEKDF